MYKVLDAANEPSGRQASRIASTRRDSSTKLNWHRCQQESLARYNIPELTTAAIFAGTFNRLVKNCRTAVVHYHTNFLFNNKCSSTGRLSLLAAHQPSVLYFTQNTFAVKEISGKMTFSLQSQTGNYIIKIRKQYRTTNPKLEVTSTTLETTPDCSLWITMVKTHSKIQT